jgi:hypothetical protein
MEPWPQDRESVVARRLRWIEALESGEYKQATKNLYCPDEDAGDSYCCLGVACVLMGTGKFKSDAYRVIDDNGYCICTVGAEGVSAGGEEYALEGFICGESDLFDTLVEMNDNEGRTFKQIASYLRKRWHLPNNKTKR